MNNQVKQQIDKETFVNFIKSEINNWNGSSDMYARVRVDCLQWVIDRIENNNAQIGLIDTPPVPTIKPGDNVYHNRFKARGEVKKISASGKRAFVIWPGCAPSYVDIKNLEVVE